MSRQPKSREQSPERRSSRRQRGPRPNPGQPTFELRARAGRAVLVERTDRGGQERAPEALELPETLVQSLHEWAGVVGTLEPVDATSDSAEVLSRRGRQLAVRLAAEVGGQVGYHDPLSGKLTRVGRQRPVERSARAAAEQDPDTTRLPRPGQEPPTPWGTGLAVAAIIAALVAVALVIISTGLAEVNALLAIAVNLAVAAGTAPSIWIGRRVLVWRWVALGAAGGIVLAWIALLLSTLG